MSEGTQHLSITLDNGTRVTFTAATGPAADAGVTHLVWLDTDPRRAGSTEPVEAGRIIGGHFQAASFPSVSMSPPVLHAIAGLLTEVDQ